MGWLPGANYRNLRNIKKFRKLGFLDIEWRAYNYDLHLAAIKITRPSITVARDILDFDDFDRVMSEAAELSKWADKVVIVPKDIRLEKYLPDIVPEDFLLGYSLPTSYGGTKINLSCFKGRKVHLLGGHPAKQRKLAEELDVFSIDCNRLTLDASFGDYFDGETFRPHPIGGYDLCIRDSISNINSLWEEYDKINIAK
jgi:hypothetical protein